jgi:hypothetical protein
VFHVHANSASIFKDAAFEAFSGGTNDHFQPAFLPGPPNIGWFTAQCGFIEISSRHVGYYILHVLTAYARIMLHVELITARTEKWATPTFLLVI